MIKEYDYNLLAKYYAALERSNYLNNAKPLAKRLVTRFKKQYKNIFD